MIPRRFLRVDRPIAVSLPSAFAGISPLLTFTNTSAAYGGTLRTPASLAWHSSCARAGGRVTSWICLCQLCSRNIVVFEGLGGPNHEFIIRIRGGDRPKRFCGGIVLGRCLLVGGAGSRFGQFSVSTPIGFWNAC